MEIRPVEGEGCDPGGYVVELLGHVEFRELRHEACEAAMAILESEVARLRELVERLYAERGCARDGGPTVRHDAKKTTVIKGKTTVIRAKS
jgi:hypothetical protein